MERVEIEAAFVRDDEFAVEHDPIGELREERFAQFGEIAKQRLLVTRLKIELVTVTEHDTTKPVPLGFVRNIPVGR